MLTRKMTIFLLMWKVTVLSNDISDQITLILSLLHQVWDLFLSTFFPGGVGKWSSDQVAALPESAGRLQLLHCSQAEPLALKAIVFFTSYVIKNNLTSCDDKNSRELGLNETKAGTEVTIVEIHTFADGNSPPSKKRRTTANKHQEVLGVGIYYFTYSTWEGPVLYVEDLFVVPSARGEQRQLQQQKHLEFCNTENYSSSAVM